MGCWHRCGYGHWAPPFREWPPEPTWDAYDYEDWRGRRQQESPRPRRWGTSPTAEVLEARLASLRAELERIETALAELDASGKELGQQ
jgi:hypothetical protein